MIGHIIIRGLNLSQNRSKKAYTKIDAIRYKIYLFLNILRV